VTISATAMSTAARLAASALAVSVALAMLISACGVPEVPIADSSFTDVVTATPLPIESTPTPTITPTPEPTVDVGAAPEPTARPAPQPGLSDTAVRVAVIADSDTGGVADDLFRDAWSGTLAWATAVNDAGGLGERQVEVVTLDARLFNHEGVLRAVCQGDFFAIVGSQSLGDYEGAELLGTEDCNLADFVANVHGERRADSPNTFVPNPILNEVRQAGPTRWLIEQFPEASQSVALFHFDELRLASETERLREMLVGEGMQVVQIDTDFEEGVSERILRRWEEFEAEGLVWNSDPDRLIDVLREFDEIDASPTFVLCELGCYSEQFLRRGGAAVEGVYTWIPHRPFDSPDAPNELLTYRFWLKETAPELGWSEIGLESWMAGRLFEEAFNRLLVVNPNALNRGELVAAANSIDAFSAGGILPLTDPGARMPTPCFALMVVRDGRWVQEYPRPPRDLDCTEDNLYTLTSTRLLGRDVVADTSSATSVEADAVEAEDDLENPEEPAE